MTESETPTALELRASMECVVLPPLPGASPSPRPPVEIFLGTEPAQYRANRVFGYSIEKVRDPGREVRIYLMSELEGFDRRGWTTGFTNYRFAIPAFCGGRGRAIYNDEDEIYLTDPGVLFDLDLGGAGYLAIADRESSVMLIDCERMAPVWTLEEARHGWKRALLRKASKATGLRGDLDPHWNARDEEFVPGRSHLLHYTTLHTQPWRPFPERFVYQEGAYTQLWHDLEREAIARGFELFRRDAPSKRFLRHRERLERLPRSELPSAVGPSGELARSVEALARQAKCRSWIELLPDLRGEAETRPGRFGLDRERRLGLLEWLAELPGAPGAEGVVCADGLEGLPVWDIPWVIDTLFARSRGFVFAAVRCRETPRRRFLHPPAGTAFTPDWWRSHFEASAVRHPHVRWELLTTGGRDFAHDGHRVAFGGPRQGATPPRIWTLTDGEARHEARAAVLAQALGGACEAYGPGQMSFSPPWPDLLITAGRGVVERARRIREQAHGRCLVAALGAGAALPVDSVDLAVVERGEVILSHPRLLELEWPLVCSLARPLRAGAVPARLAALPGPRLVVRLEDDGCGVGLDVREAAALGRLVAESAKRLGASLLLSRSAGVPAASFEACRSALGELALIDAASDTANDAASPAASDAAGHAARAGARVGASAGAGAGAGRAAGLESARASGRPDALWPALVAGADLFVVAGASEGTLAEVCATGRPVFLAQTGQRPIRVPVFDRLRGVLTEAVVSRARARPANDRGTTRPQEGLEWLAARLVAAGSVRPRRDPDALRRRLLAAGHARLLAEPLGAQDLAGFPPPPPCELERVTARLQALLGTAPPA